MIIDSDVLRELCNEFWREDVCEISILAWNFDKGLICFQVSYLSPSRRMHLITQVYTKSSYVNY